MSNLIGLIDPNGMSCEKNSIPLVIGFFDGVHKGHEKLLRKYKEFNILTFINHPSKNDNFIYPFHSRTNCLDLFNPNNIFVLDIIRFNFSPIDFIHFLKAKLNPSKLVVGSDFKFGENQTGDVKLLKDFFDVDVIPIDEKYKTSKVKELLVNANFAEANKLLVLPYMITGKVIHGKHDGTKLGFPTANVKLDNNLINLKEGSYSAYVYLTTNDLKIEKYKSAVFIKDKLLEAHLFDFKGNLYDKIINIELIKFFEGVQKPKSFDDLREMINKKAQAIYKSFK